MNSAVTETEPRHRVVAGRHRSPVAPGSTAVLVATSAAEGGGAAALQPWEGTTLLARLVDQFASLGIERVHVLTRPAWAAAVGEATRAEVHAGDGPADDLRAIGRIAAGAAGALVVAYADIVTQREVLAGLLAEPRMATGIISTGGPVARPYGFKTRARRGRIISAGSPYHAVRSPTGTFLGVVKVAPADRPGVPAVSERLAALLEAGPSPEWQEELAFKTQHWHRMLALSAIARERGEPAPPREQLDAAELSPETRRRARAPARDRARRRHRAAARRHHPLGRARQGVAPALAVLGAPAVGGRARPRGGRDPRARRGPRAAQLGGQGLGRLLHHVLRLAVLQVHRALGGAPRDDPQPGHADLRRGRRAGRRRLRHRRAPMAGGGRGAPVLGLRARLRRRPARALHAPVLQARRLARLDLRPHEGVRRVRRARDRREPDRRPGVAARGRRADAADRAATGSTSPIPSRSTR